MGTWPQSGCPRPWQQPPPGRRGKGKGKKRKRAGGLPGAALPNRLPQPRHNLPAPRNAAGNSPQPRPPPGPALAPAPHGRAPRAEGSGAFRLSRRRPGQAKSAPLPQSGQPQHLPAQRAPHCSARPSARYLPPSADVAPALLPTPRGGADGCAKPALRRAEGRWHRPLLRAGWRGEASAVVPLWPGWLPAYAPVRGLPLPALGPSYSLRKANDTVYTPRQRWAPHGPSPCPPHGFPPGSVHPALLWDCLLLLCFPHLKLFLPLKPTNLES